MNIISITWWLASLIRPTRTTRFEILLPLNYNDGAEIEEEKFDRTAEELAADSDPIIWHVTAGSCTMPFMAVQPANTEKPQRWYRGANIPMRLIRKFARDVARRFRPDKIILFGSYAYGTPREDSDVDILVIMPARNTTDMAAKIHLTLMPPFPIDLIVRTPADVRYGIAERESFLVEITERGKTLYEKSDTSMGKKGRVGLGHGPNLVQGIRQAV